MNDFDGPRCSRPKIRELEALIAVADIGSFSGAAAELDCTQSSLSHAIAELEARLGATLLVRSRSGTRPTAVGVEVIGKARTVLGLCDDISAILKPQGGASGIVRLATYRSVATHLMPPVMSWLAEHHPGVVLEIDDDCPEREDVEARVRTMQAEIGVAVLPVSDGLVVRPFARDDFVAIVPKWAVIRPTNFWADIQVFSFCEIRFNLARSVIKRCRENGMTAAVKSSFHSESAVLQQVALNNCFSIMPRLAAEPMPEGVKAIALPIPATRHIAAISRPGESSPALNAVRAALQCARPAPEARTLELQDTNVEQASIAR